VLFGVSRSKWCRLCGRVYWNKVLGIVLTGVGGTVGVMWGCGAGLSVLCMLVVGCPWSCVPWNGEGEDGSLIPYFLLQCGIPNAVSYSLYY
jgi:hypothetical protein